MPSKKKAGAVKSTKKAAARSSVSGGALPPYGDPINEAIVRGDVREMKKVAADARKWMANVQKALDKLDKAITKVGGP